MDDWTGPQTGPFAFQATCQANCQITETLAHGGRKRISIDPDTAERTPEVLKKVTKAHDGFAGVYGAVLVEGTIRPGDEIELIA